MEDVLHAVHHHRRIGHFGELHDALEAQQFVAVGCAQQLKKHLQRAGGNGCLAGDHEAGDVLVVAVAVEMHVAVIMIVIMMGP